MNFALLGNHPTARALCVAAIRSEHRVVRTALASSAMPEFPNAVQGSWEDILTDNSVNGVVVGDDSDEIQFAAKQLASAGLPLLIMPNLGFADACAYELSLIRDDARSAMIPAFRQRFDPELQSLSRRMTANELGAIRRIQLDVELPSESAAGLLRDDELFTAMLPDVDVLRWLGGNYDRVTYQCLGQTEQGCSQATLILSGSQMPDGIWTARRGAVGSWRLTIESDRGTTVVDRQQPEPQAMQDAWNSALLAAFVAASETKSEVRPDWPDAVRVFDVLDAAKRSLRRRRTIDLHFEMLSERQQFKTQMTAMGCGLLMLTLVLMLGLLALGSLLDSRDRAVRDAAAAGLVFHDSDFQTESAELSQESASRLEDMASRLKQDSKSVYVETPAGTEDSELNSRRRSRVARHLAERGVVAADHRTLLTSPRSPVWEWLMKILRLAWLAPLLIFLGMQFLLFVAKPSTNSSR